MILTVEISMYPLQANYIALITDFVAKLNTYPELRIVTTPTATMVVGEYERVMQTLTDMLRWSYQSHGKAVFITKFIADYNPD